ncbi:hypothetical protein FRC03_007816, partial [Tulasnella sp. 419]
LVSHNGTLSTAQIKASDEGTSSEAADYCTNYPPASGMIGVLKDLDYQKFNFGAHCPQ